MIIQCERCKSRFRVDETLLDPGGTQVRCSICRHIFRAFPPAPPPALADADQALERPAEERTNLEEAPYFPLDDEESTQTSKSDAEIDFDALIESVYRHDDIEPEETAAEEETPDFQQEDETALGTDAGSQANEEGQPGRKNRIWLYLLIFFTLLLAAGAGVWFFAPEYIPSSIPFIEKAKPTTEDTGARQLRLAEINGRFMPSEKAGSLFVINGTVINQYPEKRSFVLLRANLVDEQGQIVQTREAYAGNSLKDEELKTMTMEEITARMQNRYGVARSNFNIEPGAALPFTIVFGPLPGKLREFTVEAVESSPGM
ncbi:DUF3426 domain-containing protein [Desulfatiglans anilini]|uniref:DUF3426 domain-containing protein n=1 Tax=Desulfatiglans anilini TaxID=90728 RepID=UPI000424DD6D|nr:DUF3426 domain-containing protein [Desulfatiglans anilini]